jgi:tRNA-splicing endonuclease subunit Sen54
MIGSIYRLVSIIPFHSPPDTPGLIDPYVEPSESNATITYHVYKPGSQWRKTDPGAPDFYVSVINARASEIPTTKHLETLLRQTPFIPSNNQASMYHNLRTGYRNVMLAVVDQGLISFLQIADAAFGCHALWKRKPLKRQQWKGQQGKRRSKTPAGNTSEAEPSTTK